jgi:DNA-directed RNA polymerase specialized sigma subunit
MTEKNTEAILLSQVHLLPEPYQQVLTLYDKGLSLKSIAEHLNCSVYQVRNCVSKGLFLLKKQTDDASYINARKILYGK